MNDIITPTNRLPLTNEDTVGPYYPISYDHDDRMDLTKSIIGQQLGPDGDKIILRGRYIDKNGDGAHGALIEFWQANAQGVFRTEDTETSPKIDPHFDGYTRCRTVTGDFELKTIKSGTQFGRAPNITLTFFSDGISRLVTQVFFENEISNEADPVLMSLPSDKRDKLIARHIGKDDDNIPIYDIEIILAGEGETPFFDDFLALGWRD